MNYSEEMSDRPIDNEAVFEQLYKKYFRELHAYAYSLVSDWDIAEEIVQTLFLKIWEKEEAIQNRTSIRAYLYRSIYHSSLNHIRRQKVQSKYQSITAYARRDHTDDAAQKLGMKELELNLQQAFNKLPEKCRAIFHLSRFEEMRYQQIADQLQISIKTVETHMGKALKILRKEMKEFLPIIAIMLFYFFRS